eukprot:COSAG01_NODE_5991_length_3913_cov_438.897483_10_plen_43_part_00
MEPSLLQPEQGKAYWSRAADTSVTGAALDLFLYCKSTRPRIL